MTELLGGIGVLQLVAPTSMKMCVLLLEKNSWRTK